ESAGGGAHGKQDSRGEGEVRGGGLQGVRPRSFTVRPTQWSKPLNEGSVSRSRLKRRPPTHDRKLDASGKTGRAKCEPRASKKWYGQHSLCHGYRWPRRSNSFMARSISSRAASAEE